MKPLRFATHSKRVQEIATQLGWLPSARYTNLRDVKTFARVEFIDIDFKSYNFEKHLTAVKLHRPHLTVARDIFDHSELDEILEEASILNRFADNVIIVPKDPKLTGKIDRLIPDHFLLGYSTPSRYGKTLIEKEEFTRPTHILGGRPDTQRTLADYINTYSFDCNRFTLDAAFGDYFVGDRFRPHPIGGYDNCIRDSILKINEIWEEYRGPSNT